MCAHCIRDGRGEENGVGEPQGPPHPGSSLTFGFFQEARKSLEADVTADIRGTVLPFICSRVTWIKSLHVSEP